MPEVLVLIGPIGAGKSTASAAVSDLLRARGHRVDVFDLDDLAVGGPATPAHWDAARVRHAELVAGAIRDGADVVIAHGPLGAPHERRPLLDTIDAPIRWVLLLVDLEEAGRRVQLDPTRGASRDLAFLARTHASFAAGRADLPALELVIDTAASSVEDTAAAIGALVPV